MTAKLVTVEHNQLVFEAMLQMLRHNVHHLPVMRHGKPLGVIALSDVVHYESRNSLFVVSSIFRQSSVDELAALTADVHASFVRMVNEDASSRMVGIGHGLDRAQLQAAVCWSWPKPSWARRPCPIVFWRWARWRATSNWW